MLTEYEAGAQPLKYHFPERNRIIAGLVEGLVVCEAKMRSGSLITCERALEEGREVYAIPGSIMDGKSDGCHHLIQEGQSASHQAWTSFLSINFKTSLPIGK